MGSNSALPYAKRCIVSYFYSISKSICAISYFYELTIMPSRFFGFLQKGKDLDMPSAAMLMAELERATDAGMNALTHDRTARMQANRNIFLNGVNGKEN